MSESIDRTAIRRQVRETLKNNDGQQTKSDLLETLSNEFPKAAVKNEVDELERLGFIYTVSTDGNTTVKLV